MTLRLTPAMIQGAYEFLRVSPPFSRWKLPHGDEIEFRVSRRRDIMGAHNTYVRLLNHIIDVSDETVGHTATLIETVAHEMIHLHQAEKRSHTPNTEHNAEFHRFAKLVCRHHGFDPKGFV
jgi:hypothetical protein